MSDDSDAHQLALLEKIVEHGLRVRAARQAARRTTFELAERTSLTVHRIEAFETGRATPRTHEAEVIGRATAIPAVLSVE